MRPARSAGLSTYRHYLKPAWSRAFGLTPDEVDQLVAAVSAALDGRILTREELAHEVSKRPCRRCLAYITTTAPLTEHFSNTQLQAEVKRLHHYLTKGGRREASKRSR
jgi:hypothetical protein